MVTWMRYAGHVVGCLSWFPLAQRIAEFDAVRPSVVIRVELAQLSVPRLGDEPEMETTIRRNTSSKSNRQCWPCGVVEVCVRVCNETVIRHVTCHGLTVSDSMNLTRRGRRLREGPEKEQQGETGGKACVIVLGGRRPCMCVCVCVCVRVCWPYCMAEVC